MRLGQRPRQHVRRVRTSTGRKPTIINKGIKTKNSIIPLSVRRRDIIREGQNLRDITERNEYNYYNNMISKNEYMKRKRILNKKFKNLPDLPTK